MYKQNQIRGTEPPTVREMKGAPPHKQMCTLHTWPLACVLKTETAELILKQYVQEDCTWPCLTNVLNYSW